MFADKIENLKNKINEFVKNGGDIYSGKRQLPYYEYMHVVKRRMEAHYGIKLTMEYMYSLCGIKFDRDYNAHKSICDRLTLYADDNGCVDKIRTEQIKKKDTVYSDLKNLAAKQNVSMMDYLFFMTPYHFSNGRIVGDSIAKLKKDLLKAYPDGDLTGIRYDNPNLYERLRNLKLMLPERLTMKELADYLGFSNSRFLDKKEDIKEKEMQVFEELSKMFPNKDVSNITNIAPTLYYQMVRISFAYDQTVQQWLKSKGFTYKTSNAGTRLSATQISLNERKEQLLPLKKKYSKKLIKDNFNDIDMFYVNLKIMQKSLEEFETINENTI